MGISCSDESQNEQVDENLTAPFEVHINCGGKGSKNSVVTKKNANSKN
jgi:hypothetical protein